jgi:plastocyanin
MPSFACNLSGACALLLVGCARQSSAAAPPPNVAAHTSTVDLPPSYRFEPAHITVTAGTTVTWTNHDNFTHSVQVDGQSEVHMLRPGESAQILFSTPGEYHYVCTLHTQNMQGSITVT